MNSSQARLSVALGQRTAEGAVDDMCHAGDRYIMTLRADHLVTLRVK